MIEIPGFIDLHTHTRYPDADKFPYNDIDESAINVDSQLYLQCQIQKYQLIHKKYSRLHSK